MKRKLLIAAAFLWPVLVSAAAVIGYQDWQTRGTPGANPASGYLRMWADTASSTFKCLTSAGANCTFASGVSISTTSPITGGPITTTGTIACATCVTSASSLTNNGFMFGAGSQGSQTVTAATATAALNAFSSTLQGVAPLSGGGTSNFLRADGTWAVPAGSGTTTIASGTSALGTSAIASGACASAVTTSATGVATTDAINASFNADPTAVTGYIPSTNGMLTIIGYPTSNNVNWKVCNNTAASVTPGAITINWRVTR